jgi:hypothetical protein
MKPLPFIISAVAAASTVAAWLTLRPRDAPLPPPPPANPAAQHEGTMALKSDQADVFRRAFWKRPDATDKILHAERREWTKEGETGLSRWQWFIAVEPGSSLTKWLREDNAFGVRPAKTATFTGAPDWFPRDLSSYEVRTGGTGGSLVIMFSRDGKKLYATDAGKGFTKGAPEPVKTTTASRIQSSAGRLPASPPPNQ